MVTQDSSNSGRVGQGALGRGALPPMPGALAVPLAALRRKADEAREAVSGAIAGLQGASRAEPKQAVIPRGRVYTSPLRNGNFAAIIPGDSVVEGVITSGISSTLSLYNTALIGRLILTWFPQPPMFLIGPLSTLCDPYLNLFRGLIPPLGGTIDLSPILAFVVLDLFTNSANALPCEIGPDGQPIQPARSGMWTPSKAAQAWHNRMRATRLRKKVEAEAQAQNVSQR
mmetsp:Transcript_2978/g.7349  ORF Transcript_2978/g.7349 Transcript_2978/m.7349 type:complete len:228 (+) Transcript_2978:131-814(+)